MEHVMAFPKKIDDYIMSLSKITEGIVVYTDKPITDHDSGEDIRVAVVYNGEISKDTNLQQLASELNDDSRPESPTNSDVFNYFLKEGYRIYRMNPRTAALSDLEYNQPHVHSAGTGAGAGAGAEVEADVDSKKPVKTMISVGYTVTTEDDILTYYDEDEDEKEYEEIKSFHIDMDGNDVDIPLYGSEPELVIIVELVTNTDFTNASGTTWSECHKFKTFAAVVDDEHIDDVLDILSPLIYRLNGYNYIEEIREELLDLGFEELVRQIDAVTTHPYNKKIDYHGDVCLSRVYSEYL